MTLAVTLAVTLVVELAVNLAAVVRTDWEFVCNGRLAHSSRLQALHSYLSRQAWPLHKQRLAGMLSIPAPSPMAGSLALHRLARKPSYQCQAAEIPSATGFWNRCWRWLAYNPGNA